MEALARRNAYLLNAGIWIFILAAFLLTVHLAANILTPLLLAMLYSILVFRFVDKLEQRTFLNRVMAIMIVIIITLVLVVGIFYFLSNQIANYFENLPEIKNNLESHAKTTQDWITRKFNISQNEQKEIIEGQSSGNKPLEQTKNFIFEKNVLGSVSNIVLNATLIPIYSFLILLYKKRFIKFLFAKFGQGNSSRLRKVLDRVKELVMFYLTGLMLQMCFIFVLSLIGFWIVGVPHAIFMALLCALLNLVPYVGILFAGAICALSTIASVDSLGTVIGVVAVIWIVQLIENNFVSPKIVGSKVRLNPLATIVAVITGGALAGVSGMFLSIPVLAIINIIIQNIEPLVPFSYLISDTEIDEIEEAEGRSHEEAETAKSNNDAEESSPSHD